MSTEENIHQGHRRRLIDKFSGSFEHFADHEILEAMLFYVLPRIDTNPLAHRLLKVFGSLANVFSAKKNELLAIDGVGEKTAEFLTVVGSALSRANKTKPGAELNTTEKMLAEVYKEFECLTTESCLVLLLDKNYRKIIQLSFNCSNIDKVSVDLNQLVDAIVAFKPVYAVLVHNHTSGGCLPSENDDKSTKKIYVLCALHGVNLVEHMIIYGKSYYSYYGDGKLKAIKEEVALEKLLDVGE